MHERAWQAAELLERAMRGEVRPVTVIARRPMLHGLDWGRTQRGPMGGGVERNHGPSMVFRVAGIDIVVITNNGQATDLGQFTSLGIDPTRYTTIAVKSMQHFRAAFEPLAREVILVDTGALCQVHYTPELYTKVHRPIWPLDPIEDPRAP